MIFKTKKLLTASAILLAMNTTSANAAGSCTEKTQARQGEVAINQDHCISDYGHYLYINVPYDNSQVTISTLGGSFNGLDANLFLYEGDDWSGTVEVSSENAATNDESISFVSRAGERYFKITGNVSLTSLTATVTGGDAPAPIGEFIVYNTEVKVDVAAPQISNKSQYGAVISKILSANYDGFVTISSATEDPIVDVANAIHMLAANDVLTDPDLNQLLYFLTAYNQSADLMTPAQAQSLSTALLAVTQMTGFVSPAGSVIQEGYAKALVNFERGDGAVHFESHLPHLLAAIQFYSLQKTPFSISNSGNATMALLGAVGSAASWGNSVVKKGMINSMLDVLSVLNSFTVLGETSLDMRWNVEGDIKWILPHSYIALARVSSLAGGETTDRIDQIVLAARAKAIESISVETTEQILTKNYLQTANRSCDVSDPLFGSCFVPPKEEDILTVTHQCTENVTIRAQSSITQDILSKSCAEIAEQEASFHAFFNTNGVPVANDKNKHLEVVTFASPEDYKKYAPEFFGINTDNGGMYLEGTPENADNQARFIAMQCPADWVGNSCQYVDQVYNLKHELVHYLDGRYIKAGSYGMFDYNVSWSEGMAEYVANGADHTRTLKALVGQTIPPLYNLLFMSYEYEDLYQWGYFAMRYLSEEHPAEVTAIVTALQAGDNAAYIEVLKGVAERTEAGFHAFVQANSQAVAPAAAAIPSPGAIGSCDLVQQYPNKIDTAKTDFTITNDTATPVSIYWIDRSKGTANLTRNYKTLNKGDQFTSSWPIGDRVMVSDANLNCLGVAVLAESNNDVTVDASIVANVVVEDIPAPNKLGQCSLANSHAILSESHSFSITNTTDTPVRLFRIDNQTGDVMYKSAADGFDFGYGTLNKGEQYQSSKWYGDRRFVVTDTNLNCLSVGVLDNMDASFEITPAIVANAAIPEVIPAPNTLGKCDLMAKHLTGPFEADFSFTNNSDFPVRVYRVDNTTGELSEGFGSTLLASGESYDSQTTWKWFGNRRAAVTDENGQCLAVGVMSQEHASNDYSITNELFDSGVTPVVDTDGDGVADKNDAFPNDAKEWLDSDKDGFGNNSDAFPNDATEWLDSDKDGFGDNSDAFPNDATEWLDSDKDGFGNNSDAFPNDATEWLDSDKDGFGDNSDVFPNDATEWLDSDKDGLGDNVDAFPTDPNNGQSTTIQPCNKVTITSGKLTIGQQECVAKSSGGYYIWVEQDNTDLYLATAGGQGTVALHYNADNWASASNAQASSTNVGTTQNLHVVANRGWRYVQIVGSDDMSGVTFIIDTKKPSLGGDVIVEPAPVTIADACKAQGISSYSAIKSGVALCTGQGANNYYVYLDGDAKQVEINTAHGNGTVKLYAGYNWPSESSHDFKSAVAGTTSQKITIDNPKQGWLMIAVDNDNSGVAIQLDVKK